MGISLAATGSRSCFGKHFFDFGLEGGKRHRPDYDFSGDFVAGLFSEDKEGVPVMPTAPASAASLATWPAKVLASRQERKAAMSSFNSSAALMKFAAVNSRADAEKLFAHRPIFLLLMRTDATWAAGSALL